MHGYAFRVYMLVCEAVVLQPNVAFCPAWMFVQAQLLHVTPGIELNLDAAAFEPNVRLGLLLYSRPVQ